MSEAEKIIDRCCMKSVSFGPTLCVVYQYVYYNNTDATWHI